MSPPTGEPALARAATTSSGLPVAPSLAPVLAIEHVRSHKRPFDQRALTITVLAIGIALLASGVAQLLGRLIDMATHLAFEGRLSLAPASPREHHLGAWVIALPVVGGLIVGLMARYGSSAIRGHGIPEAMERVLEHDSRIPARMMVLKPLSAAIAIGTGGPFGAEGPIIATGGALGSWLGQVVSTSAKERKTLLAAGAAAGMTATFGTPISAVLLAIELLLFELSPRSLVPVALATAVASAVRLGLGLGAPVFPMPTLSDPSSQALLAYAVLGMVMGVAAVLVTRLVYGIEALFERLPIHFMWWPAIGGIAVGVVGYVDPRVLGVGYENIEQIVTGELALSALASLCLLKFCAWSISLGSGTSGGTLAPLFTIGGALGACAGMLLAQLFPEAGIDVRVAGLVGMAAMFAGASRALLASVVFAFETTRQPLGLLPLLAGCAASYAVSSLLMQHTIMTRKIAERGVHVPSEYVSDALDRIAVGRCMSRDVVTLAVRQTVASARAFLLSNDSDAKHQGYPVVDEAGVLRGVLTRRDVIGSASEDALLLTLIRRLPTVVYEDSLLGEAVERMVREDIGRLPVVHRSRPHEVIGMLTRSDVLRAYRFRFDEQRVEDGHVRRAWPRMRKAG